MALDMLDAIDAFNQRHGTDLKMRLGINSGRKVAGVIGTSKFVYDIRGDAFNTAACMESEGIEGCIQVTEATYHYLRNDHQFKDRGMIKVKDKRQDAHYPVQHVSAAIRTHEEINRRPRESIGALGWQRLPLPVRQAKLLVKGQDMTDSQCFDPFRLRLSGLSSLNYSSDAG